MFERKQQCVSTKPQQEMCSMENMCSLLLCLGHAWEKECMNICGWIEHMWRVCVFWLMGDCVCVCGLVGSMFMYVYVYKLHHSEFFLFNF
jgi:hypothetical protein